MIWSPISPATAAGLSPASAVFRNILSLNLGGVAWVVNTDVATQSFTIGDGTVDNQFPTVHLGPGQGIFVAFGQTDTNISASAATVFITPGIGRP